ncbi:MAG TPA: hypothetical protein VHO68_04140, partial [Bacteroidales bacterium]|nr:hypothetical protein [Bacteroidales bacterium]
MKNIRVIRSAFILAIMMLAVGLKGQNPTYLCELRNDVQVTSKIYEFDIYLVRTGTVPFEYAATQHGITLNPAIKNGGTISAYFVTTANGQSSNNNVIGNCNSGLPFANQPNTITFTDAQNCIKISGKTPVGGFFVPNTSPGVLICRVRLVNTVDFAVASPNLTWNFTVIPYQSMVRAYVAGINTDITVNTSHTTTALVNPVLNQNLPPAVFSVTGGGSYCQGSAGVPVGLSGSETGVTYTLYKDAVAQAPTVAGTGSPITFGNQLAGTYTVTGTNTGGTTNMTGSAVVTETVIIPTISGLNSVCEGASVVYTTEAGKTNYLWTVSAGGTITGGGTPTSNTVTVTWNIPGPQSVSVIYTDGVCTALNATIHLVTVNANPATPVASVTAQPTCTVATGMITVTSPAPAAGISYSINGADYTNTSGVFTGVVPGTYSVTVKNAAGCVSAPASVTVNAAPETPATPVASVTSQPTCSVATGTITVTSPAPAAGISFSINGADYT